jgi:hypothetical protein
MSMSMSERVVIDDEISVLLDVVYEREPSAFERARKQLALNYVPSALPGREDKREKGLQKLH